jgi:sugar lactone lactonase YvrE
MSQFFSFAIGLLKPRPDTKNNTTPIQRVADNKLLDLNILRVIHDYLDTPFYFTSQDVEVEHRVIIADGINGVTLKYPTHLCELSDGCIAVAERGGLIRIFCGDILVQSIGHDIMNTHGLSGICTNSNNQLIVADTSKNQVHVFDRDGSHAYSFGSKGNDDDQLNFPYDVCVNSKGHIIVADCWNNRICVFNNEGKFISKFGKSISGYGQMIYPIGVCVDGDDNIYVVECDGYYRVSKFSYNGLFLYTFGSDGIKPSNSATYDICVTHDGKYIVVAEHELNKVRILSGLDGSLVASYGSYGTGYKQFRGASGCTITSDGRILVSDGYNKRICEIRKQ